jgi:hypothetical protein
MGLGGTVRQLTLLLPYPSHHNLVRIRQRHLSGLRRPPALTSGAVKVIMRGILRSPRDAVTVTEWQRTSKLPAGYRWSHPAPSIAW